MAKCGLAESWLAESRLWLCSSKYTTRPERTLLWLLWLWLWLWLWL